MERRNEEERLAEKKQDLHVKGLTSYFNYLLPFGVWSKSRFKVKLYRLPLEVQVQFMIWKMQASWSFHPK